MIKKRQIIVVMSIALVSFLIGTSMATDGGNPFDALWEAVGGLQSRVDSLNSTLTSRFERLELFINISIFDLLLEQIDRIDSLNASYLDLLDQVETLENQMPPQGFVRAPAYDSGWIEISPSETVTLTHNLNTTEVFVYMIGRCGVLIHQYKYGSDGNDVGTYWYDLTEDEIRIYRASNDWQIKNWSGVRVMIWKIEEPTS